MSRDSPELRSITDFRAALQDIIAQEAAPTGRDVIVLAVDGVPAALARTTWQSARDIETLQSVVPATSASAWLSSLSGMSVAEHGVVGAVWHEPDGNRIDVLRERRPLDIPSHGTIFTDAKRGGYEPIVLLGDLMPFDGAWRAALLAGARLMDSPTFFFDCANRAAEGVVDELAHAVAALRAEPGASPRLIWCFVDLDQAIHQRGYAPDVVRFLERLDTLARDWRHAGAVVVAHSDHGLVKTAHDPRIAAIWENACRRFSATAGGAGRMRWLYPPRGRSEALRHELAASLPPEIEICPPERWFPAGSLARARVGDLLVVATGTRFMTFHGDIFDHGSLTRAETEVPLAVW